MTLSAEISKFLEWLDQISLPFDADFLKEMLPDPDEIRPEEHREYLEGRAFIKILVDKSIKSKMSPIIGSIEEIDNYIEREDISDYLYDEYFNELALKNVRSYVKRAKQLKTLELAMMPSRKVSSYFRQATNCFIYGLYDAVAILSRSVIEFSIEEKFNEKRISPIKKDYGGKSYLENLINTAGKMGLLEKNVVSLAQNIRKKGNQAVHKNATTEFEARESIVNTVIVLSNVYGN